MVFSLDDGHNLTQINNVSKLMHYLECCSTCLSSRFSSSVCDSNSPITDAQKQAVLSLAIILSPNLLHESCFFIVPKNSPCLHGNENEFYNVEEAPDIIGIDVNKRISVGWKKLKVIKIMVCGRNWMNENFFLPFFELVDEKSKEEELDSIDLTPQSNKWRSDSSTSCCSRLGCSCKFSLINRRHHCRKCGEIFCGMHCPVYNCDKHNTTRYCQDCFDPQTDY